MRKEVDRTIRTLLASSVLWLAVGVKDAHAAQAGDEVKPTPTEEPGEGVSHEVPEGIDLPPLEEESENEEDVEVAVETGEEEVTEPAIERYKVNWSSRSPQDVDQKQKYDEQEPFVTNKVADWLVTMHEIHPELDRLGSHLEQTNKSTGTLTERMRAFIRPTYERDIAIRKPRTWYNPVIFAPFKHEAIDDLSLGLHFFADAFLRDESFPNKHSSPLDLALAIFNWETVKEMYDAGSSADDITRVWNSVEIVRIYADNMDKVINIYREIRDSHIFSVAELDQFSGFWDDPRAILQARTNVYRNGVLVRDRFQWLGIVRSIFKFPYSNDDLQRLV